MGLEQRITIEELDPRLCAQLIHAGGPEERVRERVTLIYLPGLGSIEGFSKRAQLALRRLARQGVDANVLAFRYLSHQGRVLTDFGHDYFNLFRVLQLAEERGLHPERIGLLGVCYGSYVGAHYLAEGNGVSFAVFVEPFLGRSSLRTPFRQVSGTAQRRSEERRVGKEGRS